MNNFADWLATAKRGDRFTYHVGLLMADRVGEDEQAAAVHQVGKRVWQYYERRFVDLVQKRSGDSFNYYAVRL